MTINLKVVLYVVLSIATLGFGLGFYSNYKKVSQRTIHGDLGEPKDPAPVIPTPEPSTNEIVATNLPAGGTNATGKVASSTLVTNITSETNSSAQTPPEIAPPKATGSPGETAKAKKGSSGTMIAYMGAFLLSLIGLGLLIARDVSTFFGSQSVDFLFNDDGDGIKNPEYEEAEQKWANGQFLEAIQMMREYLKNNPREQYVALRIAEIYEKDLHNHLAAALEYDEVLKHKLPDERWGWAAIHLCNLYFKMNQTDKAVALLRRIDAEYGETAAAEKARKRLALFDSGDTESLTKEEAAELDLSKPPIAPPAPEGNSGSKLPPGFRPRE